MRLAVVSLVLLLVSTGTRAGAEVVQQAKLTASDASSYDDFGYSLSVSGDTAVVGSPGDEYAGDTGSAYVFTRSGTSWTQQAKLTASDAGASDLFGISVSVSGDTAVMGSAGDDHAGGTDAGSAYVFTRSGTTWTQQAKLTASDAAASDLFGISVSVSGDTAVVGSSQDDNAGGTNAGSAYVFTRSGTTWTQHAKLTASDAAAFDSSGYDVAVSGETAVVSSSADDHAAGTNAGSAYVFTLTGTTWTQQAKLTASDATASDFLGQSVSVSGDTAIVGATADDHAGGTNAGSAYVFIRSGTTWTEEAKLTASDAAAGDFFGGSASVSGDTAVVGSSEDDHPGNSNAGSVYVFNRSGTTWTQQAKLTASDAGTGDFFGRSVSLDGDAAVVGSFQDDHAGGTNAGSAYVFVESILDTAITSGPSDPSGPAAEFSFSSTKTGSTFTCALDGGVAAACASPMTLTGLSEGTHTFAVAAVGTDGVADPTPATHTWFVDASPPVVTTTTPDPSVLVEAPPVRSDVVEGTAEDTSAGISSVTVSFTDVLGATTAVDATVACAAGDARSCTWQATPPMLPGPYAVTATGTDLVGNASQPGTPVTIIVA